MRALPCVDRDAVVLDLTVFRGAEEARPAPPQQLYQVFTVDGGEVVNVRFYQTTTGGPSRPSLTVPLPKLLVRSNARHARQ